MIQVSMQRSVSEAFNAAVNLFSCALRIYQIQNQFLTSMSVRVYKKKICQFCIFKNPRILGITN
jgi:hypothetical protein